MSNVNLQNYSQLIGTTATRVIPLLSGCRIKRIFNAGAAGSQIWWSFQLGASVAPFTAGAYLLNAGYGEEWEYPGPIPINELWAIIVNNPSQTNNPVPLTAEAG